MKYLLILLLLFCVVGCGSSKPTLFKILDCEFACKKYYKTWHCGATAEHCQYDSYWVRGCVKGCAYGDQMISGLEE